VVKPTATSSENYYVCTTGGDTGATEPTWNQSAAITDGTAVWAYAGKRGSVRASVDFTHEDQTKIEVLTESEPRRWVRLQGVNRAENHDPFVVDVFDWGCNVLASLPLTSGEFAGLEVTGPGYIDTYRPAGESGYMRWIGPSPIIKEID
jgi:hypothetical protein